MTFAERFGINLARCRKGADISQEELALRASLHRTEISQLERGRRLPRIDTLVKLAASLGVESTALLDGLVWQPGETIMGRFVQREVPGLGTVHHRFGVQRSETDGD